MKNLGAIGACYLIILFIAACPVIARTSNSDYVAGIQSYFQGNFNNCIHTLDRVVRLVTLTRDELCEAGTFMGAAYLQLGDSVSARREFEQTIRLVPDYTIGLDFTPVIRQYYLALRDRTFVTLSIDSEPSGVALSIDGQPAGQTPYRLDSVFAGDAFEVRLDPDPCFRPYETEVQVIEGRPNKHMFRLERTFCRLSVKLTPEDTRYVIEDTTGRQLSSRDSVPCGRPLVARLARDGFWNMTVPVLNQSSGGATLEATMTKLPHAGGGILKYLTGLATLVSIGVALDADAKGSEKDQFGNYDWDRYHAQNERNNRAVAAGIGFGAISAYLWVRYIRGRPDPDGPSNPHNKREAHALIIQPHEDMPGLLVSIGI